MQVDRVYRMIQAAASLTGVVPDRRSCSCPYVSGDQSGVSEAFWRIHSH